MYLRNYKLLLISFILSLFFFQISLNTELWIKFWGFFNIPAQLPPFSDLESISRALLSKQEGFNPYYENPNDISKKPYSYTSFWILLFEYLKLDLELNFKIFCFFSLTVYFFSFIKIITKISSLKIKFITILLFFSTANLLVIERLNIEILIFSMLYFMAISKFYFVKILIFLISIYAKLYPIFSVFIFLRNKILLFLMIIFSLLIIFLLKNEIINIFRVGIEYALLAAHGIPTLTKGVWYYSTKFNFFINNENYSYFKYSAIFLASLYGLLLFLLNFSFKEKNLKSEISIEEKLFICGAGIFIGRYLTFSNFDYSLIWLIFTIPYFSTIFNLKIKYLYFFCLFVCFNSLLFEFGGRYTWVYFYKSLIVHSLKVFIFSVNCYFFGKVLNDHLDFKIKY